MKAKCAALLIGLLVSMVTGPVKANTFSYSFTNTALLPGTDIVKGTITLNAADTAATSLTVDSNTGGFGLGQYIGSPSHNSFTVVSGNIATADFFEQGGAMALVVLSGYSSQAAQLLSGSLTTPSMCLRADQRLASPSLPLLHQLRSPPLSHSSPPASAA